MNIKKTLNDIAKLDIIGESDLEGAIVRGMVQADLIARLLLCHDSSNIDDVGTCINILYRMGFSQEKARAIVSFYEPSRRPKRDDSSDADCEKCKHYFREECEIKSQSRETILDNNLQGYCDCFTRKK